MQGSIGEVARELANVPAWGDAAELCAGDTVELL